MSYWYQLESSEILKNLGTDRAKGLSCAEVDRRLKQGINELTERPSKSSWIMLWEQCTGSTMLLLLAAAVISAMLGDYKDTIAILAIVSITVLIGFSQEYQAGKSLAALKKLAVPTVKVCRDGLWQECSARNLVPGDIISLETGNLVPADCRLLESINLRVQESLLTGESAPVEKVVHALAAELPLSDRQNLVYFGTTITAGRGQAVVTDTGMNTELGKIANLMQAIEQEQTPLQNRLDRVGQKLVLAALALVAIMFVLGLLRGESIQVMFLTSVSMAVAVVPEGLPAIVTIALAIGSQNMLKRQALIRKLPAVETLGSVNVICSDKTGTLTENCMTVTVMDVAGQRIELPPTSVARPAIESPATSIKLLLTGSALCNDAMLTCDQPDRWQALGDPTETALVIVAARLGLLKTSLESILPRVAELPFDSDRKRMTTIHQSSHSGSQFPTFTKPYIAFTKGAVGSLLEVSGQVWIENRIEPLDRQWRDRITAANDQLAANGTRVLGIAFRQLESLDRNIEQVEQDLVFIGLVGMLDPARPAVKAAVQTCWAAGIRPIMITGDHPLMAEHIARELAISSNHYVLTGNDLDGLSNQELSDRIETVSVYARVSPEQKLKIVQALQNKGYLVAMTGDGVNDGPALRKADIGIAMGLMGTDVAKEAADIVLLDDNFATIVTAVKEGRIIYDNIRKSIKYLLSGNVGEIFVMVLAPLLGMPLPLLPLQILWINLTTDGLPALALGFEPADRHTMNRPPYAYNENIFGRGMGAEIFWIGLLVGFTSLAVGYGYWLTAQPEWQTMVLTILTFSQMGIALAVRSDRDSLRQIGIFSNPQLLGAIALTFGLQLAVIYVPLLQELFQTQALSFGNLVFCCIISMTAFCTIEFLKWLRNSRQKGIT
jgi:P-type Ca2+ transporter type 2C